MDGSVLYARLGWRCFRTLETARVRGLFVLLKDGSYSGMTLGLTTGLLHDPIIYDSGTRERDPCPLKALKRDRNRIIVS
jgi:hypothetical protein